MDWTLYLLWSKNLEHSSHHGLCCFHTSWPSLCVLRLISPLIFYQAIFMCPTIYFLKSCKHISDFKLILLPKLPHHLAFWDWISAHQTSVLLMYVLRLLQVLTQGYPLKHHTSVHTNDITYLLRCGQSVTLPITRDTVVSTMSKLWRNRKYLHISCQKMNSWSFEWWIHIKFCVKLWKCMWHVCNTPWRKWHRSYEES
jgi:hypothetical protein